MDGIDAALLETDGQHRLRSLGGSFLPYSKVFHVLLKAAEFTAKQVKGHVDLAQHNFPHCWQSYTQSLQLPDAALQALEIEAIDFLNAQLAINHGQLSLNTIIACSTELHRQACEQLLQQLGRSITEVEVIGYHGQTLYHKAAQGISWQMGDGQHLANALRCRVVSAFRQQDIQHGGQGAPLVPLYHQALIRQQPLYPSAVINCGGIANITIVLGANSSELIAFDAGPGNVLLDRLMRQSSLGQQRYDQDGRLALQGKVVPDLLKVLQRHALPQHFLNQLPPKSLDSHDCQLPEIFYSIDLHDALATLAAFTADCLVHSLLISAKTTPLKQVILAGGGWYHPVILREFSQRLQHAFAIPPLIVQAQQLGWQQDVLEAEAFAYLAKRSLLGLCLSTPLTTGVATEQSGGQCFHPHL